MSEFLNMGGYGFYVWSSFGFSLLGLVIIYVSAQAYDKKQHEEIHAWIKRNKK